jgi:hypothetical protein
LAGTDRLFDVTVGGVTEHAAGQDEVAGHHALIGRRDRGVAGDDLDAIEPRCGDDIHRNLGVPKVELDETGGDVGRPRMSDQHLKKIAPLPGAHADDTDLTGRGSIEKLDDMALDDP